jgi:hypothetical protein
MAQILGSENQGIGLTTTAKIADAAGGGLIIVSGNGIHDTKRRQSQELHDALWNGVSIAFSCTVSCCPPFRSVTCCRRTMQDRLTTIST